jgi:hypothetical protein
MITLYKYLRESLLNDFDDLDNSQHNSMIVDALFKADVNAGVLSSNSTPDKYRNPSYGLNKNSMMMNGEVAHERSRIEDGILKLGVASTYRYTAAKVHDILQDVKAIESYDTIWCPKSMSILMNVIDDSIAKEINIYNGNLELGYIVEKVENITLNIGINNDTTWHPAITVPMNQVGGKVTFKNCTINHPKDRNVMVSRMKFNDIPVFKNCDIKGIYIVTIYGANILKGKNLSLFESMLDPTHQALYSSHSVPVKRLQPDDWHGASDMVVKKGTFKQVYACLNNPKKYNFVPTEEYGDTMFKINPKFKLSDIFDISCIKDLEKITIADNNIGIIFYRTGERDAASSTGFSGLIRDCNNMDLPNDKDWRIVICKKK